MSNSTAIAGHENFPKMVYPGTGEDEMSNPGAGVIVKNEEEEKWVMDGNKIEDFGKPPKEKKEEKPVNPNPVNPANPANPAAENDGFTSKPSV